MEAYGKFAYIYDRLMYDVNYKKRVDYIEKIFSKMKIKPNLALDLGCGTGNVCIEMSKRGYDMIGIDISEDMLSCAKEKALEQKLDILFSLQDMSSFNLYGSVDAIVSVMDSVNYITSKTKIKKMFNLVHKYLNPKGVFIFDINTEYKFKNILNNNVFYDIQEEFSYIWQNRYKKRNNTCEFELTFFEKNNSEYIRWDENHVEKAYSICEMTDLILESGLNLKFLYDDLKFRKPKENSEK